MGGRHVLDQDAGLTPIFTTLRRGAWQRPRPQSGRRALRPVPDLVQPSPGDPWTAPIPVVTALPVVEPPHGTGGYRPADAYAPTTISAVEPPVSPNEATAWWGLPVVAEPAGGPGRGGYGDPHASGPYEVTPYGSVPHVPAAYETAVHEPAAYDAAAYEPAGYDPGPYIPAPSYQAAYDQAAYHQAAYDRAAYEQRGYDGTAHDPAPYGRAPHDPLPHQPAEYEPVLYGAPNRFPRHDARPYQYDPLTDTGRHHRRLAPAGW
jgi:hypothetical protein